MCIGGSPLPIEKMFSVQEDILLQQGVPGGTLEENADSDQGGCTLYSTGRPCRRWWIPNVTHFHFGVWSVSLWKCTGGWATSWNRMELPSESRKSFFTCLLWTIVHSYLLITIYRLGKRQWPPARTYQKWPENDQIMSLILLCLKWR